MKLSKKLIIIFFVIILGAVAAYFYFSGGAKNPEYIIAAKGNITELVSVTGRIKPVENVDLAFEKSGKISNVYADVGNYVNSGDALVRQDSSELSAQLSKAKADLDAQNADLQKSKVVLNNYYSSIPDILNDSYTKADDAVRTQSDNMFTNPETDNPQLNFTSSDSQAATDARSGRLASRAELNNWLNEIGNLNLNSNDDLYSSLQKSKDHLSLIRNFLIRLMDALNQSSNLSASTVDSYKTDIITARTELNTALTNITNQVQDIDSQNATIVSDEANIKSYQANVANIEAQIYKTVIYSPIDGTVTIQNAKVGQIATAGDTLVSIISSSQFEVEADVPEVDIAKVKLGSLANITLDAYGNNVIFEAKVSKIDPAETIIEGVSTYKTTLQFIKKDSRIKSGLTGNVDIIAGTHSGVITIPARFIWSQDSEKFVTILGNDGKNKDIKVKTGLRGSDGSIEIIDGLNEGDKVVAHVEQQ